MSCSICCDTFNSSTRKRVQCPNTECDMDICKTCIRTYLLSSVEEPHCMNCKIGYDTKFIVDNLNRSFHDKEYNAHRKQVLFEEYQSRIPNAQTLVQDRNEMQRIEKLNKEDSVEIKKLTKQINDLKMTVRTRKNQISRIGNGECGESKKKLEFIMPCPDPECKGFLSSGYKCGICNKKVCSKCITILGEEEHVCDPDMVATAALIKKDTKPCPTCGERIMKIDGCDQMWCVKCHTTFSWNKGVIEKGHVHNPHYYQWLREQSADGTIPRNPGDRVGDDRWRGIITSANMLAKHDELSKPDYMMIERSHRWMRHATGAIIPGFQPQPENVANTVNGMTTNQRLLVKFMSNEITEAQFKTQIRKLDYRQKKNTEWCNVYTMYATELNQIFDKIGTNVTGSSLKKGSEELFKTHVKYLDMLKETNHAFTPYERFETISFLSGMYNWRQWTWCSNKPIDEFRELVIKCESRTKPENWESAFKAKVEVK